MISDQQQITGSIERITFHNQENGYSIIKILVNGKKDLVTVVCTVSNVTVGMAIEATGIWVQNKQYGNQFKADTVRCIAPNSLEGIQKYLSSGLIKGIGPIYAQKLIASFGSDIFNVIENQPERLFHVPGIGKTRVEQIIKSWGEQKIIRQIMLFIHGYDIPTSKAVRIFKTYGNNAIQIIEQNPYQLAIDIAGIGFKSADKIAEQIGFTKDSELRINAGINYCLNNALEQSCCSIPIDQLIKICSALLEIQAEPIVFNINKMLINKQIISYKINDIECIFLKHLFNAESFIAQRLLTISAGSLPWPVIDFDESAQYVQDMLKITLSATQKIALQEALKTKLLIITGGPGVGKTTIVNSILKILQAHNIRINLAAPTGRAAKRMFETTGLEAKTLHRLLQKNFSQNQYSNNVFALDCDLLIVDEVSMVDIPLMFSMLKALPNQAALFLVGDIDQLPSVGPGSVLADMINSATLPVIRLTEIFRQVSQSKIITNAYRVNQGLMPILTNDVENADFFYIESETPQDGLDKIIELATKRLPNKFGISTVRDIQILCPMNKGVIGAKNLNIQMQKALSDNNDQTISIFGTSFKIGDKVMQVENNYEKDVYNGDIGIIQNINHQEQNLVIVFDNKIQVYDFADVDQIILAYAVTIHKSQGSEYHTVIIAIFMEHMIMLWRNLLYTGITRGKNLVILVGQKIAIQAAINQKSDIQRYSSLQEQLKVTSSSQQQNL